VDELGLDELELDELGGGLWRTPRVLSFTGSRLFVCCLQASFVLQDGPQEQDKER
jgi:hypothetical protein